MNLIALPYTIPANSTANAKQSKRREKKDKRQPSPFIFIKKKVIGEVKDITHSRRCVFALSGNEMFELPSCLQRHGPFLFRRMEVVGSVKRTGLTLADTAQVVQEQTDKKIRKIKKKTTTQKGKKRRTRTEPRTTHPRPHGTTGRWFFGREADCPKPCGI